MHLTRRDLAALLAAPLVRPAFAQDKAAMPEPGRRDWADQVPILRIGIRGGENDADRLARYDAYQRLLSDTFKVPVKVFLAADYSGVIQGLAAGQLDMAGMGSASYATAWRESGGKVEPLLTLVQDDGSDSYRSVLVVRADSGITGLAGLRGKSVAWADPQSTSGYLIPRYELRQQGIDPESGRYFAKTAFAGGHEQGVIAVLHGQFDASATNVSGIGDPAQGFSQGTLRSMTDKKLLKPGELRVVWMSQPIIDGPLTVRSDLPEPFKADMVAFHEALPAAAPDVFKQLTKGSGRGYRRVEHKEYQIFLDLQKEEAQNRRRSG